MPGEVKRAVRVSARLIRELAHVLAREVRDPRVQNVVITRIEMPDDLASAKVYVRLMGPGEGSDAERRTEALKGLARAAGMLRKNVAKRVGLRHAPALTFFYDGGLDKTTRVEELLEEVKAEAKAFRDASPAKNEE